MHYPHGFACPSQYEMKQTVKQAQNTRKNLKKKKFVPKPRTRLQEYKKKMKEVLSTDDDFC